MDSDSDSGRLRINRLRERGRRSQREVNGRKGREVVASSREARKTTHVERSSRISIRSAVSKEKADSVEGIDVREEEAWEGDMVGGGREGEKEEVEV